MISKKTLFFRSLYHISAIHVKYSAEFIRVSLMILVKCAQVIMLELFNQL